MIPHSDYPIQNVALFFTCLSFLTVASNILVIMAFVMNRQLRTINNYLIINLAFADLAVGLISMNFYTAYIGSSTKFL